MSRAFCYILFSLLVVLAVILITVTSVYNTIFLLVVLYDRHFVMYLPTHILPFLTYLQSIVYYFFCHF